MISLKNVLPSIDLSPIFQDVAPPRLRLSFRERSKPQGILDRIADWSRKDNVMSRKPDGVYAIRDFRALERAMRIAVGADTVNDLSCLMLAVEEGRHALDSDMVRALRAVCARNHAMRRDLAIALGLSARR